jgi:hypothetical protein
MTVPPKAVDVGASPPHGAQGQQEGVFLDHVGTLKPLLKPRSYQQDLIDLASQDNVSTARAVCVVGTANVCAAAAAARQCVRAAVRRAAQHAML